MRSGREGHNPDDGNCCAKPERLESMCLIPGNKKSIPGSWEKELKRERRRGQRTQSQEQLRQALLGPNKVAFSTSSWYNEKPLQGKEMTGDQG